jgi:hypothetical protein
MPDPQGWPDATRPGVPMRAHRELPHLEIPGGGAPAIAAGCSSVWPVGTLKVDWLMMSRCRPAPSTTLLHQGGVMQSDHHERSMVASACRRGVGQTLVKMVAL